MHKILLVDDEQDILDILKYNLQMEGYEIRTAHNGNEAIDVALKFRPDLIVLDVMMPEMDGIETCENIKKNPEIGNTLICFLTARSEDYSQIAGLDSGGDDYLTKPIKPKVLVSRVNALLRRAGSSINKTPDGDKSLIIDRDRFVVLKEGEELSLPKKEFELLSLLYSKPGRVFERDEILDVVWGKDVFVGDRTIDVHIRKLREKIGGEYIKTIKGVGYKFEF